MEQGFHFLRFCIYVGQRDSVCLSPMPLLLYRDGGDDDCAQHNLRTAIESVSTKQQFNDNERQVDTEEGMNRRVADSRLVERGS